MTRTNFCSVLDSNLQDLHYIGICRRSHVKLVRLKHNEDNPAFIRGKKHLIRRQTETINRIGAILVGIEQSK